MFGEDDVTNGPVSVLRDEWLNVRLPVHDRPSPGSTIQGVLVTNLFDHVAGGSHRARNEVARPVRQRSRHRALSRGVRRRGASPPSLGSRVTASAGSDTIREMAGTDDVIALAFRQLNLAYGGTPRKPDAARNAVLHLPHVDARSTTPHHLQGTALHAVVRYATSDEVADATWRKTPGSSTYSA